MRVIFVRAGVIGIETDDIKARIFTEAGRRLFTIPAGSYHASLVATDDGRRVLAAGTDEPTAKLWSVATGRRLATFGRGAGVSLDTATISGDGKIVVTAGERTILWDAATRRRIATLSTRASPVLALFAPDSRTVLTIGPGEAALWPVGNGPRTTLANAPRAIRQGTLDLDRLAHFARDGRVVVAGTKTPTIYDPRGRKLVVLRGHSSVVTVARFSRDGRRIVTGGRGGTARVWDARSGKALAVLEGHTDAVNVVSFDPRSSDRVLTGSGDGTVILWNVTVKVA